MLELKGKAVIDVIAKKIIDDVEILKTNHVYPCLAILRVGNDSGQIAYENSAKKKAESLNIRSKSIVVNEDTTTEELEIIIENLNKDNEVNGILLMQPLPKNIDENRVKNVISESKDVDCISEKSLGSFLVNFGKTDVIGPCTAEAVIELLDYYNYTLSGKKIVVLGRSMVIGRPVASMLTCKNSIVTICHSKTLEDDLVNYCKNADYIISAMGVYDRLPKEAFSRKQVLIDVGINFVNGKMVGDFCREKVDDIVHAITPVPGGLGGITTILLMKHTVDACKKQNIK